MTSDSRCHNHSHDHHDHSHLHDHKPQPSQESTTTSSKSRTSPAAATTSTEKGTTDKQRRHQVLQKLKTASLLCLCFFIVEVVGGLLAGSLAVLSDAAHLCADLSAFVVAISGSHIASLPASETHTFGLKRSESLAALFSMVSLAILSVGLAVEAVRRLWVILLTPNDGPEVDGKLMATIAFIGVIVNVILAYVLGEDHVHMPGADHGHDHSHDHHNEHSHDHGHSNEHESHAHNTKHDNSNDHRHDHHHDEESSGTPLLSSPMKGSYCSLNEVQHIDEVLPEHHCSTEDHSNLHDSHAPPRNVNLHAAYLHVLADLTQSVVVFIAGVIIWVKPTWQIADPICTLIFSILVCWSTATVIRSSLSVLLEEVPPGVNWEEIYDAISGVAGVSNVHDLHIWSISHGNFILSVHANADNIEKAYSDIKRVCNRRNISHLTVQLQPSTIDGCVTCDESSDHQCR